MIDGYRGVSSQPCDICTQRNQVASCY